MSSLIFYFLAFGIILILLKKGEISSNKSYIYSGYILLFLLSALRYDIGNDYENYWINTEILGTYYQNSHNINKVIEASNGRFEIGFCVLSSLFSWSENAFFWISAFFSALVVWGLYKAFSMYNCHFWGTFLAIVTEYLFLQWDWVRQSGALALVLVAYQYVDKKDLKRFIIYIALASLLHKSAVFILLAYPLQYVRMNNKIVFSLLTFGLILYWSGVLDGAIQQISMWFAFVDGYDKYDIENVALSTHTTVFSRIRLSISVVIGALVIAILDERFSYYRNCLTIGLFIFMLGGNGLVLTRIAWYFMVLLFPCFGLSINSVSKKYIFDKMLYSILVLQFFVFSYDIVTNTNTRGCVPYKSVFSEDFAVHRFDIRDYK